jgi:NAD(P)-dependent dehydrogenase (short-subunit alcohol dehydrogenase family)
MFELTGKIAVVTGGNGGIGLGMARGLAQSGATVVLAGRDTVKSGAAVQALAADSLSADAIEDTELTRNAREQVQGLNERVLARTPAGRWGLPADLAGIAVFLASSASDFITGAAIPVDGGYSIS